MDESIRSAMQDGIFWINPQLAMEPVKNNFGIWNWLQENR